MNDNAPRIWCNVQLPPDLCDRLREQLGEATLIISSTANRSNLVPGQSDEQLRNCDIAFGQPDVQDVLESDRLKWVHLSSAGYTRYDRTDLRQAMKNRGGCLTNSSTVYADPCAQHVVAMMLSVARQLPQSLESQQQRLWNYIELRDRVQTLTGHTALLVGYGAIGRRLTELLKPFKVNMIGFRRTPSGDEPIPVLPLSELNRHLPQAEHVINLLPAAESTTGFFDVSRLALMRPGAVFYNVGRGTTVHHAALREMLACGRLLAAYLDVFDPEPLPSDDPLWITPRCYITPHTAGGFAEEIERLVEHFLENYNRWRLHQPLLDVVFGA